MNEERNTKKSKINITNKQKNKKGKSNGDEEEECFYFSSLDLRENNCIA